MRPTSALPLSYPARRPRRGSNPRPLVPKEPLPAHRLDASTRISERENKARKASRSRTAPLSGLHQRSNPPHHTALAEPGDLQLPDAVEREHIGAGRAGSSPVEVLRPRSHRWPPREVPHAFTPSHHSGLPITGMRRGQEEDDTTPCQAPLETVPGDLQGPLTAWLVTLPRPCRRGRRHGMTSDRTRPAMTKHQPRLDAIDRNARWAFGVSVVSAAVRGHRLGTDRRYRQG